MSEPLIELTVCFRSGNSTRVITDTKDGASAESTLADFFDVMDKVEYISGQDAETGDRFYFTMEAVEIIRGRPYERTEAAS